MALEITRRQSLYIGGLRCEIGIASMTAAPDSGFNRFHFASAGICICPMSVTTAVADHFVTHTTSATAWASSFTISGAATTPTAGIPRYVAWGV